MAKDLPDFQSEIVSAAVEATSFRSGLDADKPASPAAGDIWLARDTEYLYVCNVAGAWEKSPKNYLELSGGTMSGAIAMGTKKITGLGDPTLAQDAATKAYADTIDAKLDDATQAKPARALGTIYQNTSGKIRVVAVACYSATATWASLAQCESVTPPTIYVGRLGLAVAQHGTMTFIVPPNFYYRATDGGGTPILTYWTEWDLH